MQIRKHFVPSTRFGPPGRLLRCALILSVLVMFVAPVMSSSTTVVQADVAQDSTVYLPILMGPPATGPVSVRVTLDTAHRVQQLVPLAGGTLSVTGANGTKFSLAIPDGSLPVTKTITMTVVSAIQGLPFGGGLVGAVHLEPQGLLLREPAILTIEPAASVPPDRQTFFAYDGDGQEFRLTPPVFDEDNLQPIRLPVYHFSGAGMASGTEAERVAMLQRTPSEAADQISQEVAALVQRERAALLANQPGDPEFWTKLEALARQYHSEVVQPALQQAFSTVCHGVEGQRAVSQALNLALGWARQLQLLGLNDFMADEQAGVMTSLIQALSTCWMDATNPCMDWKNPSQVERVISIAHEALVLGLSPEVFNPWIVRKCVGCEWAKVVSDWTGSVSYSYQQHSSRSQYGTTTTADAARSATMNVSMQDAADWGGLQRWSGDATGGSGDFNDQVVDTSQYGSRTQTWIGSGALTLSGSYTSYAKMGIDPAACKYSVEFHPYVEVAYTNYGHEESRLPRNVGTPYLFELPVPDAAGRVLSGMLALPATVDPMQAQNTFTHFDFGGSGSAAELEAALGKDNLGTAPVEWTLSPAPYW